MQMVDKYRMVLRKIYELAGPSHMELVNLDLLQRELGMSNSELLPIVNDFEDNKGWLSGGVDEAVSLTPTGITEVEFPSVSSGGTGNIYQNVFQGPFQGAIQQGGQNNVQNNMFGNSSKLDENVKQLIEVIRASNLNQLDRDDFIQDVRRVKQLIQQADTPGALERAQEKLDAVKTGLEIADTGGELLGKALPYITVLWHIITSLNS